MKLTAERRAEIATLFVPEWESVLLAYRVRDRDLMDAWRLAWQKLGLALPAEMSIMETRRDFLQFMVQRQEISAVHLLSRQMVQAMYFPAHALDSLCISLDDALRSRAGEVPAARLGRTA